MDADLTQIQKEFEDFKQRHDILVGKKQTWEEQTKKTDAELKKPLYKTADDDYREMLIKVKVFRFLCLHFPF